MSNFCRSQISISGFFSSANYNFITTTNFWMKYYDFIRSSRMRSIVQPSAIITESHLIANQSYYDLCIMISSYAAIQIETENKLIRIQRFRDVNVESIIVAIQKRQRTNDNKSFRRDWSWFDDGKINELYCYIATTQGNYNFVVVMFASDDGNDDIQISTRNDSVSIVSGEQWIAYGSNMAHTHNAGCLRNRARSGSH